MAVGTPVAPELETPEYLQQQVMTLRGEWEQVGSTVSSLVKHGMAKAQDFFCGSDIIID